MLQILNQEKLRAKRRMPCRQYETARPWAKSGMPRRGGRKWSCLCPTMSWTRPNSFDCSAQNCAQCPPSAKLRRHHPARRPLDHAKLFGHVEGDMVVDGSAVAASARFQTALVPQFWGTKLYEVLTLNKSVFLDPILDPGREILIPPPALCRSRASSFCRVISTESWTAQVGKISEIGGFELHFQS